MSSTIHQEIAAALATPDLAPAAYLKLARAIAAGGGLAVRVHVLSSFSAQFVMPYLQVETYRLGLPARVSVAGYMQLEQALTDPTSGLDDPSLRCVLLLVRPDDIDVDLYRDPHGHDPFQRLAVIRQRLLALLRELRVRTRAALLVANAFPPPWPADAGDPDSLTHAVHEFNRELGRGAREIPDCHVFDWAGSVAEFGAQNWVDERLWHMGKIVCGQAATVALARRLARALAGLVLPRAKCVVTDLDDTLWGGVLGDDGLASIQLGDDYPGVVYKGVQYFLKGLTRRGILLAIASKNSEETAREAFDHHPEMVLRWDDFSCHRVNWEPKSKSIREIAEFLNIGTDSIVFIDNNPLECAMVRQELPEVHVVCLGADPLQFRTILSSVHVLDRTVVTQEDRARVSMYRADRERKRHRESVESTESFLAGLAMEARVGQADATTLARIAQLVQKTNQFNLTTRRHTADELRTMAGHELHRVAYLRLSDRFGDLGLVCVGVLTRGERDTSWRIDTLLMSCRVMGRGIEDCFLGYLAEVARAAGGQQLVGEYIPTAKNGIVRDFFEKRGFRPEGMAGSSALYSIDLGHDVLPWSPYVKRVDS
jgi:FkbH-like protein